MTNRAFAESVWSKYGVLVGLAMQHGYSEDTSRDMASETVARALASRDRFDGTNLIAWLRTIQSNKAINDWRHNTRWRTIETEITATQDYVPPPDELLGQKETSELVQAAIERLGTRRASIVRDVELEGHSYLDAASRNRVPLGTVMSSIHRSKRLLAAKLQGCS